MRDRMDGFVVRRPIAQHPGNFDLDFTERDECFITMLTDEAGFAHIARQ